jgi:hypothetical protein
MGKHPAWSRDPGQVSQVVDMLAAVGAEDQDDHGDQSLLIATQ